jgi:hypothetical protein
MQNGKGGWMAHRSPGAGLCRRRLVGIVGLTLLAGCSDSAPEKAEVLAQIAQRIRESYAVGEKRVDNLTYEKGEAGAGGRFNVQVSYDLITAMPTLGLFNTLERTGTTTHVANERYAFVRGAHGWTLE